MSDLTDYKRRMEEASQLELKKPTVHIHSTIHWMGLDGKMYCDKCVKKEWCTKHQLNHGQKYKSCYGNYKLLPFQKKLLKNKGKVFVCSHHRDGLRIQRESQLPCPKSSVKPDKLGGWEWWYEVGRKDILQELVGEVEKLDTAPLAEYKQKLIQKLQGMKQKQFKGVSDSTWWLCKGFNNCLDEVEAVIKE
jgi:hypothetical protein